MTSSNRPGRSGPGAGPVESRSQVVPTSAQTGIHPAAAIFPMLSGDDLKALAEDIREHGLRHPIVRTPDGQILDGRNRLAACKLVGKRARYDTYDGDPWQYVISANLKRRDLTKVQRAILAAKAMPRYKELAAARRTSGKKLPKGGKAVDLAGRDFGVSGEYVRKAAKVLEFRSDLADELLISNDDWSLDHAYYKVLPLDPEYQREKAERDAQIAEHRLTHQTEWEARQQEVERLREEYADAMARAAVAFGSPPDIREMHEIGVLTPEEAIERSTRRVALGGALSQVSQWVDELAEQDAADVALELRLYLDHPDIDQDDAVNLDGLRSILKKLEAIASAWESLK